MANPTTAALEQRVKALEDMLFQMKVQLDGWRTQFNAHTHSATSTAVVVGQQFADMNV